MISVAYPSPKKQTPQPWMPALKRRGEALISLVIPTDLLSGSAKWSRTFIGITYLSF